MKTYSTGTKVFCDYHFGGKPEGKAIEIIEPGDGKGRVDGKIKVKITKTSGAYKKGEIVFLPAWQAVPIKQEIKLKKGQFIRRVNTNYEYVK